MNKLILTALFIICFALNSFGQCKHTLTINSFSADCNGDETSTVTIDVTVLFGSGNNSATISYNIGGGDVVAVVLEDDDGDIIDQTYMFNVPTCDNYSVILAAWTNPSGSGSSCTDPPPVIAPIVLPVLFGDLNLELVGSYVELKWSTFVEVNNDIFEIQRSLDNINFQTVGEVNGHINSASEINYQFKDRLFENGTYYYKIKQVDLDGRFSFSEHRKINFANNSSLLIYPNPAHDFISLSSLNYDQFKIYNVVGEVVQQIDGLSDKNEIDISNLEDGMYFLVSMNGVERKTFIKQ